MISKIINGNEEIVAIDYKQLNDAVNPINADFQELSDKVENKVEYSDLTSIIATGFTNTTGAMIPNGAYFYLNDVFCRAIADIAVNATFTKNTNYVETSVGGEINSRFGFLGSQSANTTVDYTLPSTNGRDVFAIVVSARYGNGGVWIVRESDLEPPAKITALVSTTYCTLTGKSGTPNVVTMSFGAIAARVFYVKLSE